jgi:hypothetical protein
MPLAHDEITAISLDVIRRHPQPLDFVGVMAFEGGSGRGSKHEASSVAAALFYASAPVAPLRRVRRVSNLRRLAAFAAAVARGSKNRPGRSSTSSVGCSQRLA